MKTIALTFALLVLPANPTLAAPTSPFMACNDMPMVFEGIQKVRQSGGVTEEDFYETYRTAWKDRAPQDIQDGMAMVSYVYSFPEDTSPAVLRANATPWCNGFFMSREAAQ